jgi:hypothetical protein
MCSYYMIIKRLYGKHITTPDLTMIAQGHALFIVQAAEPDFVQTLSAHCSVIEINGDYEDVMKQIVKHRTTNALLILRNFNDLLFIKSELPKRTKGIVIIKK